LYRAVVHYKFFLHSLRKVAQLYNVSKSLLQRWIHNDPTIRKVWCKKQTDNTVKQCVKDLLEDNPFATWAMIAEALSQHCQLKASRSTAGRLLSVVGGNTKRKDRVVVADTPPQEALSHNKTTWIVVL
jgi:transposase